MAAYERGFISTFSCINRRYVVANACDLDRNVVIILP